MKTVQEIVSEELVDKAWANARFGNISKRDVIKEELQKCADGYHTGHTAMQILKELGLTTDNWKLTKLGKRYLRAAHSNDVSI